MISNTPELNDRLFISEIFRGETFEREDFSQMIVEITNIYRRKKISETFMKLLLSKACSKYLEMTVNNTLLSGLSHFPIGR